MTGNSGTDAKRSVWLVPGAIVVALAILAASWFTYRTLAAPAPGAAPQGLMGDAASEDRVKVALLIGNSAYALPSGERGSWPKLTNPGNDVGLVKASLEGIGFEVTLVTDADWDGMQEAIASFSQKAARADVALFYFAGHGFEFDRHNYLVPTDAPGSVDASDLPHRFIDLELATRTITRAGTTVFMLDACRTPGPLVTISQENLVPQTITDYDFPAGAKVAVLYSTARGIPAKDGVPPERGYSPFAFEVARNIVVPHVDITDMFNTIRKGVYDRTSRFAPPQAPYTYNSLDPGFFLATAAGGRPISSGPPKPLAISQQDLATIDETVLAVRVLAEHPVSQLETLAAKDHPLATYLLGYMLEFGVGMPQDLTRARSVLARAAALGTPSGQLEYAYFLRENPAEPGDKALSLDLYRKAAGQGFAKAQGHLGDVLMRGELVDYNRANYDAGLAQHRLAAKQGYPYSIYALAVRGTDDERPQWRKRLEKLAAVGNIDGDHWLCELNAEAKNYAAALPHCTIAATVGFSEAQARMALAAFNGWGRNKSADDARHWLRQALSQPTLEPTLRDELKKIEPRLAPAA